MTLERWTDLSKWQGDVPGQSLRAMKSDGITGICVGSWHGIDANPYVKGVLRRSRDIGLDISTYYVFNSRPGLETVERAVAACGSEWDRCIFHAPDVEIRGITEAILRDGIDATFDAGGWPIIYTGNWFWNWWKLDLGYAPDFRAIPSWIAVYNGRPDLVVTPAWGLGAMRIHQYRGSTSAYGTTVDFNVADKAWMDIGRRRFLPPPEPESQEDNMKLVKSTASKSVYVTDGRSKRLVRGSDFEDAKKVCGDVVVVSREYLDWLWDSKPVTVEGIS